MKEIIEESSFQQDWDEMVGTEAKSGFSLFELLIQLLAESRRNERNFSMGIDRFSDGDSIFRTYLVEDGRRFLIVIAYHEGNEHFLLKRLLKIELGKEIAA